MEKKLSVAGGTCAGFIFVLIIASTRNFLFKSEYMKKNSDNQVSNKMVPGKKHSSALSAAARGERATDRVRAKSTRDVNGASGMRNTGTNVSYEEKE
jgi:hypothetical protein